MRTVVFAINITADGYCGHEDGIADEELHDHFTEQLRQSDVILFGRKTYELMVPYWPDVAKNGPETGSEYAFARVFDSIEKVVFSRTYQRLDQPNTRLARAAVADEVLALRSKPGKTISVGSLSLASQLSARGLIDEYQFVVHPIVAGKGPRLFEAVSLKDRLRLHLVGTKTFGSGAVALQYTTHA